MQNDPRPGICQIGWIRDNEDVPTFDENPAIGEVWCPERVDQICGRGVVIPESRRFPVCAEHAAMLPDPGMHIWNFEPYQAKLAAGPEICSCGYKQGHPGPCQAMF